MWSLAHTHTHTHTRTRTRTRSHTLHRIVSVVKKLGKGLSRDTEMLGSYPPKNEFGSVDIAPFNTHTTPHH